MMQRAAARALHALTILALVLGMFSTVAPPAAAASRPAGYQGGRLDADKWKPAPATLAGPDRLLGSTAQALPQRSAYAWGGNNGFGEFGDGTTAAAFGPIKVRLDDIRAVAAGDDHSIFLLGDGRVVSVGRNIYGQLGDGTTTDSSAPVQVINLPGAASQIAGGDLHGLALVGGQLYSWGYNANGQLGDGTNIDRPTPVAVPLPAPVTAIAGGASTYQTLAIAGGTVYAWGFNGNGELGDGTTTDRPTPLAVPGLTGTFIAVAAGEDNSLALRDDGAVFGWGFNGAGELCVGDTNQRLTPAQARNPDGTAPFAGAIGIGLGNDHGFIIGPGGTLYGCGTGTKGELGIGSDPAAVPLPAPVRDPVGSGAVANVTQVVGGEDHSAFLRADGTVYAMGSNLLGQIGVGRTDGASYYTPARVVGLSGVSQLAASKYFTLVVVADAALAANPTSLTFDAQKTATTSPPQTVTLTSTSGPLNLARIAASGDFAQTNTCPRTLAAGQRCTVTVTFSPTQLGARSGALTVSSDALGSPLTIPLGGTGIAGYTVSASATAGGTISPSGKSAYTGGTLASYTATPAPGYLFLGWTLDNASIGFASPLSFTVNDNHTLVARFALRAAFSDVPAGGARWDAITQLAARGIINGYGDGTFGPTDALQRAQIAALIVRAMGWDGGPVGSAPFSDLDGTIPDFRRAIAILAARGIAKGYPDGTFDPTGEVNHAQTISLITRSMVQAGSWQAVTAAEDDGSVYPNVPRTSDHRLDLLTFVKYAGAIPDRPTGQAWEDWLGPSSRGWTAQVLWLAYSSYFGTDRVP